MCGYLRGKAVSTSLAKLASGNRKSAQPTAPTRQKHSCSTLYVPVSQALSKQVCFQPALCISPNTHFLCIRIHFSSAFLSSALHGSCSFGLLFITFSTSHSSGLLCISSDTPTSAPEEGKLCISCVVMGLLQSSPGNACVPVHQQNLSHSIITCISSIRVYSGFSDPVE